MYVRELYRRSVVKTMNVPSVVHNEANVICNQPLQLRDKEFENTASSQCKLIKQHPNNNYCYLMK